MCVLAGRFKRERNMRNSTGLSWKVNFQTTFFFYFTQRQYMWEKKNNFTSLLVDWEHKTTIDFMIMPLSIKNSHVQGLCGGQVRMDTKYCKLCHSFGYYLCSVDKWLDIPDVICSLFVRMYTFCVCNKMNVHVWMLGQFRLNFNKTCQNTNKMCVV